MSCVNLGCLTLLFLPEDEELAVNQIFSFSLEIKKIIHPSLPILERNLPVYDLLQGWLPNSANPLK